MDMFWEYVRAFLVGGLFCVIGQILINYTKITPARILVIFVVSGVILGGFGLYQPIIEYAGAGATIPLTGFGALIAKGTKEAIEARGLIGALTGGLSAASAGISAAIVFGLIVALVFKPKAK